MKTEAPKVPPAGDTPRRMADALNAHADFINTGQKQARTVAELADEEPYLGKTYICTDEAGGITLVFADGTNWRRVQDRAVVS